MSYRQLNQFKRQLLRPFRSLMTSNSHQYGKLPTDRPLRILLTRINHRLGNQLLVTPLIEELQQQFPGCQIDLCVQGQAAAQLHTGNPQIVDIVAMPRKPFKELATYLKTWWRIRQRSYDLAINVATHSTSGRMAAKFSKSRIKLMGDEFLQQFTYTPLSQHLALAPVYNLRGWLEQHLQYPPRPLPNMHIQLTEVEKARGIQIVNELNTLNKKRVVALYTYATNIKCYTASFWKVVYTELKKTYPEIHFIEILPFENISPFTASEIPQFYSRDLRELATVLGACELAVVADSGMMHLAAASGTSTIGLFKLPYMHKYTPYSNGNTAALVNDEQPEKLLAILSAHLEK